MPSRILLLHRRTLVDVVGSTEDSIHLFEANLLGLWYEEPDESSEQNVDSCEHLEGVESFVLQEEREKLLHDAVYDVLALRAHADGLGADVHGEDLGGEDPYCGAPGWLVCSVH